jgi:hypothetical protein
VSRPQLHEITWRLPFVIPAEAGIQASFPRKHVLSFAEGWESSGPSKTWIPALADSAGMTAKPYREFRDIIQNYLNVSPTLRTILKSNTCWGSTG